MDRHDFGRAPAFGSEGHDMWIAGAAALLIGLVLWKVSIVYGYRVAMVY